MSVEWLRSNRCDTGTCIEVAVNKAARCESGSCVEVGIDAGEVLIRDSKDPTGPVLRFTQAEWHAFVDGIGALAESLDVSLGSSVPSGA